MKRILMPTTGPGDWARGLAKREHWKRGASAMSLAACWESAAPHFPGEILAAFAAGGTGDLADLSIVVAMPEFKTTLPGGSRASQTDLMVLARNDRGTVAVAVEGKVEEPFGPTVGEKRRESSDGQADRLRFLEQRLGLTAACDDSIRYQLLHRAVSALIFASEIHAGTAVLVVHSFSEQGSWYGDFEAFAKVLGATAIKDAVVRAPVPTSAPLYLAWVTGDRRFAEVDIPPTQ